MARRIIERATSYTTVEKRPQILAMQRRIDWRITTKRGLAKARKRMP